MHFCLNSHNVDVVSNSEQKRACPSDNLGDTKYENCYIQTHNEGSK